jgi:hypothetical protein
LLRSLKVLDSDIMAGEIWGSQGQSTARSSFKSHATPGCREEGRLGQDRQRETDTETEKEGWGKRKGERGREGGREGEHLEGSKKLRDFSRQFLGGGKQFTKYGLPSFLAQCQDCY